MYETAPVVKIKVMNARKVWPDDYCMFTLRVEAKKISIVHIHLREAQKRKKKTKDAMWPSCCGCIM
jgi:hypothetical protein